MPIFLRVAALFWKYWPRALVVYSFLFAGAGLALLIPRLSGQAIDLALSASDRHSLSLIALGVVGAGLLRSILSYWQSYISEYLSQRVAYDLRSLFYNRLQRLSYSFHDRSQTGQLMSRATADVEGVRMFVGFALLRGAYFLLLMIAITAVLLALNWKLALISQPERYSFHILSYCCHQPETSGAVDEDSAGFRCAGDSSTGKSYWGKGGAGFCS
ncbi:MAG: hypothetical protein HYY80_01640 [Chloroflexi bacterium]|nr:hypothetical protein [Chloroflexota bacterium]